MICKFGKVWLFLIVNEVEGSWSKGMLDECWEVVDGRRKEK